jgi:predicted DCC family thiol-disulfide oxidoreductase YuxK
MSGPQQVIFFDGVCNLCNGFVDFLLSRDESRRFLFASLQGETAQAKLPKQAESLKSVVLWTQGKAWEKSDAVLRILPQLGGPWRLISLFRFTPRFLRDWVYDRIAANRYRLFGRRESCRLPSPEEKARFLP